MSLIKYFDRDWLDYEPLLQGSQDTSDYLDVKINLDKYFFENLKLTNNALKSYRIDAAKKCAETLGDNVALCVSGGIDSQAMLYSFKESGIPFKVYTFVFEDNLNSFDVDYARKYCYHLGVELVEIPFNVIQFLTRENWDTGLKYNSVSPHFNVHYKFCDILKEKGHTGVCFGGIAPYPSRAPWGNNFVKNIFNYITYSELSKFPVQGSFLSFYPELSWAIALLTPLTDLDVSKIITDWQTRERAHNVRYANKVLGYANAGFDIIESKKLTGFEEVKTYFKNISGDGWEFEKRFRKPLEKQLTKSNKQTRFVFEPEIEETILRIRSNY